MRSIRLTFWFVMGLLLALLIVPRVCLGEQSSTDPFEVPEAIRVQEFMSDKMLLDWERYMMAVVARDLPLLVETVDYPDLGTLGGLLKHLRTLKYVEDAPDNDYLKFPLDTLGEGGDCEDLTAYTIAEMFRTQFHESDWDDWDFGFILLWIPQDDDLHMAAVAHAYCGKCSKKHVFVIDFDADGGIFVETYGAFIEAFCKAFDMKEVYHRVWWIGAPVEKQKPISLYNLEKDTITPQKQP